MKQIIHSRHFWRIPLSNSTVESTFWPKSISHIRHQAHIPIRHRPVIIPRCPRSALTSYFCAYLCQTSIDKCFPIRIRYWIWREIRCKRSERKNLLRCKLKVVNQSLGNASICGVPTPRRPKSELSISFVVISTAHRTLYTVYVNIARLCSFIVKSNDCIPSLNLYRRRVPLVHRFTWGPRLIRANTIIVQEYVSITPSILVAKKPTSVVRNGTHVHVNSEC